MLHEVLVKVKVPVVGRPDGGFASAAGRGRAGPSGFASPPVRDTAALRLGGDDGWAVDGRTDRRVQGRGALQKGVTVMSAP